jgi:hypothetical protein
MTSSTSLYITVSSYLTSVIYASGTALLTTCEPTSGIFLVDVSSNHQSGWVVEEENVQYAKMS